jgi:pimeloyl-ACP methyl ester carboxylesterase
MPFITVNGKRLNYADTKPEAPDAIYTIIFVHGLGSTQNYFFPILPHLTDYRCITFDNYGAGRSKYDGQPHSIETIGQDVLGILDHLKVSKAVVVGYSMGGMLPTYLAATAPERVVAAVCVGPVNPSPAVAEVFQKRISAVREGGMEAMADTIPGAATGSRATALHRAFVREMLMAQEVEGYVANCRAIGELFVVY